MEKKHFHGCWGCWRRVVACACLSEMTTGHTTCQAESNNHMYLTALLMRTFNPVLHDLRHISHYIAKTKYSSIKREL